MSNACPYCGCDDGIFIIRELRPGEYPQYEGYIDRSKPVLVCPRCGLILNTRPDNVRHRGLS